MDAIRNTIFDGAGFNTRKTHSATVAARWSEGFLIRPSSHISAVRFFLFGMAEPARSMAKAGNFSNGRVAA